MTKLSKRSASEAGGTGRWSAKRKVSAVLWMRCRVELKVNAATLSSWRDVFLANGLAGLTATSPQLFLERLSLCIEELC